MKLTIYIPTYRRSELAACLESIAPQLTNEVELIVSDNDPQQFAKNISLRYPQAQYSNRHYNIEGDPNVLRGLVCGSGEYVWVFGDDDTMLPGTIETLLPMLDGVDRIIHWSANAGKTGAGFNGAMSDYITSLTDKSILVASTLTTANVWRRAAMNVALGLNKVDTKYPLFWAGLTCETVKVMSNPTITVGHVHRNVFGFFNEVIDDYLQSLLAYHNVPAIPLVDALHWNFVNVSQ
jgi:glycosyltransferase involved in cell wall biosynthesis